LVLAGGLGTRMRPLTDAMPKALLPALGRAFAEWQIDLLTSQGIRDFVFLIGHRGDAIRSCLGDGRRWGVRIRYVDEGERLRGTAGAIRFALDSRVLAPVFVVVYGDSYTRAPLAEMMFAYEASGKPALMAVLRNEDRWDRSNVIFEDGGIVLYDKWRRDARSHRMTHIDYGVSVLSRSIVNELVPQETCADLASVFHQLSKEGRLAGFEVADRFYEIGSPEGLLDFEQFLREGGHDMRPAEAGVSA
jgi:NDP-sugar pyrophosphorylase family protein